MRIIKEVAEHLEKETHRAEKILKKAIKYKAENKELADMMYNLAMVIIDYVDKVHSWLVKYAEKMKSQVETVPPLMLEMWDEKHKALIEKISKARIMAQSYVKL